MPRADHSVEARERHGTGQHRRPSALQYFVMTGLIAKGRLAFWNSTFLHHPHFPPHPFPPFTPYVKTFEVDPENLQPEVTQDLPRQRSRPTSLSTSEPQNRRIFWGTDHTDPLARIQHAAPNILTLLREVESGEAITACRGASSPTELSDVPTDASFSVSVMHVRTAQVDSSLDEEEGEGLPREQSGGKSGSCSADIEKQQGVVVARYLDTVDEVLFGGSKSVEARCMSRNIRCGKRSLRGSRGAKTDARAERHSISTRWCPILR
ncbi:hypothetical protein EDB87DRAFT_1827138 [Lactarius vividus]|nr:hypothetical protein EDB87DRAFT_1827138 [Lactarius vividus]